MAIDIEALREEMNRLKETKEVKAYLRARGAIAGASGTGQSKARPQKKKAVDSSTM